MRRSARLFLHCTALVAALAAEAAAQPTGNARSAREVRAVVGHATFVDESPLHHFVLGGGVRAHLTRRLWLGADALRMWGPGTDRDLVVEGVVEFDLADSGGPLVPYLVAAGGLLVHQQEFPGRLLLRTTEPTASGGAGLRIRVSDRFVVSPEARLGFELHTRIVVNAGYRF
jgi:hypothetical protein